MPTSIEAQGVTVDEAIQVALNKLGVTRDRVEIEIVHHPRAGILGIGARRAKVRATLRAGVMADGEEFDMSVGGGRAGGRRRRRSSRRRRGGEGAGDREGLRAGERTGRAGQGTEARSEGTSTGASRGGQGRGGRGGADSRQQDRGRQGQRGREGQRGGRGRGRGGDGGQQRAARVDQGTGRDAAPEGSRSDQSRKASQQPETRAAKRSQQRVPEDRHSNEERSERGQSRERRESGPRLSSEEIKTKAVALTGEIAKRMGFEATVTADVDEAENEVIVQLRADAEGLLIGRRGQTLDALEHLLNRMIARGEATAESHVVLDVGGYRERRKTSLLELAERLKVSALTQRRRVQVSPMSPRDRKILQNALVADDAVSTRVLGSGFYRRVLIVPAGLEEDESSPIEEVHADSHRGDDATLDDDPAATG
jgi:spoIIIJ-associated protein